MFDCPFVILNMPFVNKPFYNFKFCDHKCNMILTFNCIYQLVPVLLKWFYNNTLSYQMINDLSLGLDCFCLSLWLYLKESYSLFLVLFYWCLCSCSWCLQTPGTVALTSPLSMGILQARMLEWVTMPSSRGSSPPRDQTQVSCIAGRFFTSWASREAQEYWSG